MKVEIDDKLFEALFKLISEELSHSRKRAEAREKRDEAEHVIKLEEMKLRNEERKLEIQEKKRRMKAGLE